MMLSAPPGCMKTITPSSLAFAQNGSNFGSESDCAVDVAADRRAAQPELLDAVIELLGRQIRELQRHRRQRDEPILVIGHPLAPALRSARGRCGWRGRGPAPPTTSSR